LPLHPPRQKLALRCGGTWQWWRDRHIFGARKCTVVWNIISIIIIISSTHILHSYVFKLYHIWYIYICRIKKNWRTALILETGLQLGYRKLPALGIQPPLAKTSKSRANSRQLCLAWDVSCCGHLPAVTCFWLRGKNTDMTYIYICIIYIYVYNIYVYIYIIIIIIIIIIVIIIIVIII
jgi:hypothetical protein